MHNGVIGPADPYGVPIADNKFLSKYLQERGYKTHMIGKVSHLV